MRSSADFVGPRQVDILYVRDARAYSTTEL